MASQPHPKALARIDACITQVDHAIRAYEAHLSAVLSQSGFTPADASCSMPAGEDAQSRAPRLRERLKGDQQFSEQVERKARDAFAPRAIAAGLQKRHENAGDSDVQAAQAELERAIVYANEKGIPLEEVLAHPQFQHIVARSIAPKLKRSVKEARDQLSVLAQHVEAAKTGGAGGKGVKRYVSLEDRPELRASEEQLTSAETVAAPFAGTPYELAPELMATLSPTQGLVGPSGEDHAMPKTTVVGGHGVYHDAGGLMKNAYGVGPGYTYMDKDKTRDGLAKTVKSKKIADHLMRKGYGGMGHSDPDNPLHGQLAIAAMGDLQKESGIEDSDPEENRLRGTAKGNVRAALQGKRGIDKRKKQLAEKARAAANPPPGPMSIDKSEELQMSIDEEGAREEERRRR